jgi:hypothetical protein
MAGNPRATPLLTKFLEQGDGILPREVFAAKSAVLTALGYLAPSDPEAMTYLRNATDPGAWSERVRWLSPFASNTQERDSYLSKRAILALGLTGDPFASNFLLNLQHGNPVRLSPDFDGVIAEALRTNDKVQHIGIMSYEQRAQ